ncbi:MAG: HigA family addiction module antidote protein [Chlamydiales bacterium]|nr:HigA family addiction module antidote protein [Chlamydiales bacterium]
MSNKMRPIHPGEILADELEELEISANALARYLAVPPNRVTYILNGKRAITADTALRLAKFFGTTPEFWLNLQADYDLKIAIKKSGKKIEKEVLTSSEAA